MGLSRDELVALALRYFQACNDHDWQAVMATFSPRCLMWFPAATFTYRGTEALGAHFKEFLATFETINFHDFSHVADATEQSICSYFTVDLVEPDGAAMKMRNCNIFKLDDSGLFDEIIIYNSGKLDAGFHAGSE